MSHYLNPSLILFQQSLNSAIYVDKTGLLAQLNAVINTEQRNVCISRPQRFGKTMALKMAAAYYTYGLDADACFEGLTIKNDPSYAKHLNKYDVLYISMATATSRSKDIVGSLAKLSADICAELETQYSTLLAGKKLPAELFDALALVSSLTGRQFIFLIDEWDCLLREHEDRDAQKSI
jgi:hypothetical protein